MWAAQHYLSQYYPDDESAPDAGAFIPELVNPWRALWLYMRARRHLQAR